MCVMFIYNIVVSNYQNCDYLMISFVNRTDMGISKTTANDLPFYIQIDKHTKQTGTAQQLCEGEWMLHPRKVVENEHVSPFVVRSPVQLASGFPWIRVERMVVFMQLSKQPLASVPVLFVPYR